MQNNANPPALTHFESANLPQFTGLKDGNLYEQFSNPISPKGKVKTPKSKSQKKIKKPKDSVSPKKLSEANNKKFIRSKSQPGPNFFLKSDYLFAHQKKICIPDWKIIGNSDQNSDNDDQNGLSNIHFDVGMHEKLEIFENRIVNGTSKYSHPAYSVQLADDEDSNDFELTEAESKKFNNYTPVMPKQQIPLFWERRSYDTEESLMTEEDSLALKHKIEEEESEESFFNLIKSSPKYKYNKKYLSYSSSSYSSSQSSSSTLSPLASPYSSGIARRKKKDSNQIHKERSRFTETPSSVMKNRKSTEIEISNLYYETDESFDETDIELF